MCLLSAGVDTLELLLRIWLWISVPMAVLILLAAAWMNYLRNIRPRNSLSLAIEAAGEGSGAALAAENALAFGAREAGAGAVETGGAGEETVGGQDREELTGTGKETIYQGILWMKEQYEQYRQQADRRYELLREELGRSEKRYGELIQAMEQSKSRSLGTVMDSREGAPAARLGEREERSGSQSAEVRVEPDAKQAIIEELESQLRVERIKVEELVLKLQANSELILRIYRELESIPDLGKK